MNARTSSWLVAVALIGAFVVGYDARRSVADRRQAEWELARAAVARELGAAVLAGARRWSPEALVGADGDQRAAVRAHAREHASFWSLPDYTHAHSLLRRASTGARRAATLARQLKHDARLEAEGAVEDAGRELGASVVLAGARVEPAGRAARARLLLAEAGWLLQAEEYRLALASASQARALVHDVAADADATAARYRDTALMAQWRRWIDETVAWSARTGRRAVVVSKVEHRLTLYVDGRPVQGYDVDLSHNWVLDKSHAGDGAVPEGRYEVVRRKDRGESLYYRALLLNYPNDEDRRAFAAGARDGALSASVRIGGLIEIHGEGGRGQDWTRGCVALANSDLDRLFPDVDVGTPVTIVGAGALYTADELRRAVVARSLEASR